MLGKGLAVIGTGVLAAVMAFVLNWLALIPWRRVRDRHWTERARAFHPVRIAALANLAFIPALLTLAEVLLWPDKMPPWVLVALVSAFGTIAGTIPMDHEVFPRTRLQELVRQSTVS